MVRIQVGRVPGAGGCFAVAQEEHGSHTGVQGARMTAELYDIYWMHS